jgi:hypothetical protein
MKLIRYKRMIKKILNVLILFALILSSCTKDKNTQIVANLENNIKEDLKDLNINSYSYIITNEKQILKKEFQSSENDHFANSEEIIENFRAPLILKQMIDNSLINEDTLLLKYIPTIKDKSLKVLSLLKVPANQTELNPMRSNEITRYIKNTLKATHAESSLKIPELDIDNVKQLNDKDLLKTLAKLSLYFDSKNVTGRMSTDGKIPVLTPNFYARNLLYFAGWNVLKMDGHTIFWNFFTQAHKSLLLIKMIDTGVFAAISYQSKNIPSPFDNNKSDLLQSPLATTILKSLLDSTYSKKKLSNIHIKKQLQQVKSSKLNFLYMHDLTAHAKAYEYMGKIQEAASLYRLYEKYFPAAIPLRYLKQEVLAEFQNVPDNFDGKKYFELKKDTKVRLFGSGQILNDTYIQYHLNTNDGVEIYLDMFNKKSKTLNIRDNQYFYRFNYGYTSLSGNFLSKNDMEFAIADPNDSVYMLEVKMPWKTLGDKKPKIGEVIGLNMLILDKDLNESWRKITWSTTKWWDNNPSLWGTLILSGKPVHDRPKIAYCSKTRSEIKIDGDIDNVWNKLNYTPIDSCVASKFNISGGFKTLWDEQAIYFLFRVVDNVKNQAGVITIDKGWIENATTGEVLYQMTGATNTPYFPTFSTDKTFTLKAGKYFLKYSSDDGHSSEKWYGKSPQNGIYGAVLYKCVE